MNTFILAIFGLFALANAQRPQIQDVYGEPGRAYEDPGYKQPAMCIYLPCAKRWVKRAAYPQLDVPLKAYADPGYDQPAKRWGKRAASDVGPTLVAPLKAYADPGYEQPAKRLAKSFTPKINDYYYDHAAYPVQRYGPPTLGYEQPAKRLAKREAPKINDYYYEDVYGEPGRVAPVAKTNDDNDGHGYAKHTVGPKPYIAYERLAKRDAAAYAQPNEPKIAAVSVEDLNNPEYEDAPQQEAQARSADYEADDLLAKIAAGLGGYGAPPAFAPDVLRAYYG